MATDAQETSPVQRRCCGGKFTWMLVGVVALGAGGAAMSLRPGATDAGPSRNDVQPIIGDGGGDDELTPDERMRALIVGDWEMDRDGHRDLTVNDDGTAVMKVTLDSAWQYVFGAKMTFEIEWEINDGMLSFQTTGGTPKTSVDLVTKAYGSERTQPILELTESRMLLKDVEEGEPDHDWSRVR